MATRLVLLKDTRESLVGNLERRSLLSFLKKSLSLFPTHVLPCANIVSRTITHLHMTLSPKMTEPRRDAEKLGT